MNDVSSKLDAFFHITERGSDIKTEVKGGIITFLAMSYILVSNPAILSASGVDVSGLFTATALASVVACLLMALYARFPVALAPGMGINAFVAYTVVLTLGFNYSQALLAVLLAGVAFFLTSITGFRTRMLDAIPKSFRLAITAGIGFFIAVIGLFDAGIIHTSVAGLIEFGDLSDGPVVLALFCILFTFVLWFRKWWGAVIVGMIVSVIIGLCAGIINLPDSVVSTPDFEYFGTLFDIGEFDSKLIPSFIVAIFSLFVVDMFDSAGTLLSVGERAGIINDENHVDGIESAMVVDSVASVFGAVAGTSTTTAFVESTSGIESGARTGLMTLVVALLFAVALFFGPIFSIVTFPCIVGALVLVGVLMMTAVKDIDWSDSVGAATCFMTIVIMALSYSISNGIGFGAITYVLGMIVTGRAKEVNKFMYFIAALFIVYFVVYYAVIPNL